MIKNLFFHIHYCNSSKWLDPDRKPRKLARTLSHHELVLATGGKGSITVGSKSYPVKEGMLYYLPSGIPHAIDPHKEEPGQFLTVHFSYAHIRLDEGHWSVQDETAALSMPNARQLKDYRQVDEVFNRMIDCWHAKLPGYEFLARTLLQQLLGAIYLDAMEEKPYLGPSVKIEKAIRHMHQNLARKISLTELASVTQLSPTYLSRTFKEITGYSVVEYFNKLKVDRAKALILDGDKKIKEIAHTLGFTDEFYFSRLFKQMEGVSPTEFYSKNIHVK